MRKLLVLSLLVVSLLVVSGGMVQAEYYNEVSNITNMMVQDMQSMSSDINSFSNGSMSADTFLDRLESNRRRTLNNLVDMIALESKADNKEFHAETTSLISNWLLAIELVRDGLKENEMSKIEAATIVMGSITEKANYLTEKIKSYK